MRGAGSGVLTIRLEFDSNTLRNLRLHVSELKFDHPIDKLSRFEIFPTGVFDGFITAVTCNGLEWKHPVKLKILPDQNNLHEWNLTSAIQVFRLIPVDHSDRFIAFAEVKVEGVDTHFKTVREPQGVEYALPPGDYRARIMLPSLSLKILLFKVVPGVAEYRLRLEEKLAESPRVHTRFPVQLPVSFNAGDGFWLSAESVNISPTGLCVISQGKPIELQHVAIRLFVPNLPVPLECPARVCWSRANDGSSARSGMQLFLPEALRMYLSTWLQKVAERI